MINKSEVRVRLFIDNVIERIIEINDQLNAYASCMNEDDFNNSKDVEQYYNELKYLINKSEFDL